MELLLKWSQLMFAAITIIAVVWIRYWSKQETARLRAMTDELVAVGNSTQVQMIHQQNMTLALCADKFHTAMCTLEMIADAYDTALNEHLEMQDLQRIAGTLRHEMEAAFMQTAPYLKYLETSDEPA